MQVLLPGARIHRLINIGIPILNLKWLDRLVFITVDPKPV